eukprot:m.54205 g.54205  ORF g.54205 m.54205 type:complete len:237 (+) comp16753_c0_seq1:194-904(+)
MSAKKGKKGGGGGGGMKVDENRMTVGSPARGGAESPGGAPAQGTEVAVTKRMADAAVGALSSGSLPSASKHRLEQVDWAVGGRAPFSAVKLLVAAARVTGSKVYLHEMMQGSHIVVDAPFVPEPTPAMLERRKMLQAAVAEKDYQRRYGRMDGSKSMRTNYVAPLDVQEGKKVFALVVQLLITMAACFAFGWYAVGSILVDEPAMMALGGVVCMIAAVGAELYFLMKTSILSPKLD